MEVFGLYLQGDKGEFDFLYCSGDFEGLMEIVWSCNFSEDEYEIKDLF